MGESSESRAAAGADEKPIGLYICNVFERRRSRTAAEEFARTIKTGAIDAPGSLRELAIRIIQRFPPIIEQMEDAHLRAQVLGPVDPGL
jgi:hypothetical protein